MAYGYCGVCFERAIKNRGELPLIVEAYKGPGTLTYKPFDRVYAHFYKVVKTNGVYTEVGSRQWCLAIYYESGYPCPPTIKFVNPYRYTDDNPLWWPQTKFFSDPIKQIFDIAYLSARSSYRPGMSRGDTRRNKPLTESQYLAGKKRKPYSEYLETFKTNRDYLANCSDYEAHDLIGRKWAPDALVATFADKIEHTPFWEY